MLAFEGTDLPEAIILRSMSGGNGIFGAVVSPIGAEVWWFGSAAVSGFVISAPIFQVLPVAVRHRQVKRIPERETPAHRRGAGG